jgi:hypothetical protein
VSLRPHRAGRRAQARQIGALAVTGQHLADGDQHGRVVDAFPRTGPAEKRIVGASAWEAATNVAADAPAVRVTPNPFT